MWCDDAEVYVTVTFVYRFIVLVSLVILASPRMLTSGVFAVLFSMSWIGWVSSGITVSFSSVYGAAARVVFMIFVMVMLVRVAQRWWAVVLFSWMVSASPFDLVLAVWLCRPPVIRTVDVSAFTDIVVYYVVVGIWFSRMSAALYAVISLKNMNMPILFYFVHLQGCCLFAQN